MNVPYWLKPIVFSVMSGAVVYLGAKNPGLFPPEQQAAILGALAAYLGYKTNGKPTP